MKRRQLVELHDLSWYPEPMREIQTEILSLANISTGFVDAIVEPYLELLEESAAARVFDLCSGASGPVVAMQDALVARGFAVPRLTLSDLYPNLEAWERLRAEGRPWLDFAERPVDATKLPRDVEGELITIVNGLHHFPEEVAWTIIGGAVQRRASIFVAEGFPRDLLRATAYLPSLVEAIPRALASTRGRKLAKLAAILTVLPLTGGWDWLVSALRIHEPSELLPVAMKVAPHYRWTQGERSFAGWGRAVYLAGTPRSEG
jgi:hypothetical protein